MQKKLGLELNSNIPIARNVYGVVEMMFDATQNFNKPITHERLYGWDAALFPTGFSGMYQIEIGLYRSGKNAPHPLLRAEPSL